MYVLYTYVSVVRRPLIVLDNAQMVSEGPGIVLTI